MNSYIILSVLFICYLLFFYLGIAISYTRKIATAGFPADKKQMATLNIRHCQGIILLGIPLTLFLTKWQDELEWPVHLSTIELLIFCAVLLIVIMVAVKSAYPKQLVTSRDITKWENPACFQVYNYFFLRISFLVVYECFFRGILLTLCIDRFAIEWAIAINSLLYAAIHVLNGKEQVIASVPFGVALCMFCIGWQSVWPAILLHLALSLTNEGYRFYLNHSLIKKVDL
jgi:membrane protease YdiL (CAAX protease family)